MTTSYPPNTESASPWTIRCTTCNLISALTDCEHRIYLTLVQDLSDLFRAETRDASEGSVLVRADATTLPGYWSEIDTADPGSNVRRDLEERWFGAFSDWLARITKVKSDTSADLLMQKSFSSVLFSASQSCASDDGTTTFDASMQITANGNAAAHLNYGIILLACQLFLIFNLLQDSTWKEAFSLSISIRPTYMRTPTRPHHLDSKLLDVQQSNTIAVAWVLYLRSRGLGWV